MIVIILPLVDIEYLCIEMLLFIPGIVTALITGIDDYLCLQKCLYRFIHSPPVFVEVSLGDFMILWWT